MAEGQQATGEHLPGEDDRARLERLAAIFEHSNDAIVGKTLDGIVTDWNPAAERIYGWTAGEMVGQSIARIFPPDRLHELEAILAHLRQGEEVGPQESERLRKDGTVFPVLVTVSPIRDRSGQVIAGSKASLDLSNLHRRQVAEEALRLRDQFLTSVAHDLQQPLVTIIGQAQLVLRQLTRGEPPDVPRLVATQGVILASARHLSAQIAGLVDQVRLEAGRPLDLQPVPVDLVVLTRQLVDEYALATERHDVRFEVHESSLVGMLDPLRVRRLLGNVLSNALKYSPAGGAVTVSLKRTEVDGRTWAVLTVQDEGVGIPEADLPHVFGRGYRAANVVGGQVHGSGLGLAGARMVAEQHGGTIEAVSREGAGTTVTLRLPL